MNRFLKPVFLFLFAVMSVIFFGCAKNEVVEEVQEVQETENVDVFENKELDLVGEEKINTSDWLAYQNEEFGFSFQHPKGWNVELEKYKEDNIFYIKAKE